MVSFLVLGGFLLLYLLVLTWSQAELGNRGVGADSKTPERNPFSWSEDREMGPVRATECEGNPYLLNLFFLFQPCQDQPAAGMVVASVQRLKSLRKTWLCGEWNQQTGHLCARSVSGILLAISSLFYFRTSPAKAGHVIQKCITAWETQTLREPHSLAIGIGKRDVRSQRGENWRTGCPAFVYRPAQSTGSPPCSMCEGHS